MDELRGRMKEITCEIFKLCGERLRVAKKIGEIKAKEKIPLEDSRIEEDLRKEVLKRCREYCLEEEFCERLFNLLIAESKKVQKEVMRKGGQS